MRIVGIIVAVAACGTEQGAYLTLTAPDGPTTASTYELVLASPDLVKVIAPQRVTPTGTGTETVTYYLQKTEVAAQGRLDGVNGFTILVEPDGGEGAYIPFLLLHDGSGALVGIGTFRATDAGAPAPILVKKNEVDRYELAIEPVTEVTDADAVATRQAMRVDCIAADQTSWPSGVVWRPRTGGELRVMLADPKSGGDATARTLDLDCDDHEVAPDDTGADCDDTRARFHAGAPEQCDMEDTNCDNVRTITVPCQSTTACNGMGVALCDDTTGTISQSCAPDPACACANGTTGCTRCILEHETNMPVAGQTVPCQPGLGQLSTQNLCDGGATCVVEVLGTRGGWDAQVGTSAAVLGPVATGVGSSFVLQVRRPEGPNTAIPGQPGHNVGAVDLDIIDRDGVQHYVGVALDMDTTDSVCPQAGTYQMACSP